MIKPIPGPSALIQARVNARAERCADGCPGWVLSVVNRVPDLAIEACDECNALNPTLTITDAQALSLPAAASRLHAALEEEPNP